MKGITLPINLLIIVAVAVIVLIALVAMFYPAFSSGSLTVTLESAKTQGCRSLALGNNCNTSVHTYSIPIYGFDANKDSSLNPGTGTSHPAACLPVGENDNLARLCRCYFQADETECRTMCGCY